MTLKLVVLKQQSQFVHNKICKFNLTLLLIALLLKKSKQTNFRKKMISIFKLSILAIGFLLSGCGTVLPQKFVPISQIINKPSINETGKAEVGETMISKANIFTYPAISLAEPVVDEKIWSFGKLEIPAGIHKIVYERPEGKYFSNGNVVWLGKKYDVMGVFVPSDGKKARTFALNDVDGKFLYGKDVTVTPAVYEEFREASFKKELVYGGLSQKNITITYREFKDNTARPAFNQDLRYDLTEGDIIGFRGARFQVVKATNTYIEFKVINPLN